MKRVNNSTCPACHLSESTDIRIIGEELFPAFGCYGFYLLHAAGAVVESKKDM